MNNLYKTIKIMIIVISIFCLNLLSTNAIDINNVNLIKIDYYILENMNRASISALTLTVVKDDQVIYQKIYQTKEFLVPLTLDTPFYIGSIGKSFTALAIKQLSSKGLIDMEAYVSQYLPWFNVRDIDNNEIKIKNLMNHTSGFTTDDGNLAFTYQTKLTIETLAKEINNQIKLNRRVGTGIEYSNLNFVILGAIIERVSGLSYEDYVREYIYTPLDMNNTYHSYREAKEHGLLPTYRIVNGFSFNVNVPHPNGQVSAGYQMSSTHDLTNYLLMFLNQGYFNSKSLFENNPLSTNPVETTFNPYWKEITIPVNYFGHAGSTFSSTSQMTISQNDRLGILILTNSRDISSRNPISASSISKGIISILNGETPFTPGKEFNWRIVVYNSLVLWIIMFDIIHSTRYLKSFRKPRKKTIILWAILDGIIPLSILMLSPKLNQSSWLFMLNASPEYIISVFVGSISIILVSIIRTFFALEKRKR
jgi:CubicO group peptidase (beta-lactamase class C family)